MMMGGRDGLDVSRCCTGWLNSDARGRRGVAALGNYSGACELRTRVAASLLSFYLKVTFETRKYGQVISQPQNRGKIMLYMIHKFVLRSPRRQNQKPRQRHAMLVKTQTIPLQNNP